MRRRTFLRIALPATAVVLAFVVLRPHGEFMHRAIADAVARNLRGDRQGALATAELAFRTAYTSDEAAALASWARAAVGDLPAALRRMEAAARRDPADAESALGAGLIARHLARRAQNGPEVRAHANRWIQEAVRRAEAAASGSSAWPRRLVAAATCVAAGDGPRALAHLDADPPPPADLLEQADLLRAAAHVVSGDADAAASGLRSAMESRPSAARATALARVGAWRDRVAVPPRERGLAAWAARDPEGAVASLSLALDERPEDPVALTSLAEALARTGDDVAFVGRFEKLAALGDRSAAAPYFRGVHLLACGRPAEAVAPLEVARRRAPDDPRVLESLVRAHLDAGAPDEAVRVCRARLDAGDPSGTAAVLLGAAFESAGRDDDAERAYRAALRDVPGHATAADRLADLLVRSRRPAEALAALAGAGDADTPAFRLRTALARSACGDADGAEADLRGLVDGAPGFAAARAHLGRSLAQRRDVAGARAAFEAALRADPDCVEAHLGLLGLAAADGTLTAAAEWIRNQARRRPDAPVLAFAEGVAADLSGDVRHAEGAYRRALSLDPRFALASNNLAWLLAVHRGDPVGALPFAEDAVRRTPRSPQALDTRGWVRFLLGDAAGAESDLSRARAALPGDGATGVRYARVLLALGRADEALDALRDAAAADPRLAHDPEHQAALARAEGRTR